MVKKILKGILKLTTVLVIVVGLFMFVFGMNPFKKSGFANCVEGSNPNEFIGKRLKHAGSATRQTIKTEQCVTLDVEKDNGDGPSLGNVRWVECSMGPDCDEAGMF